MNINFKNIENKQYINLYNNFTKNNKIYCFSSYNNYNSDLSLIRCITSDIVEFFGNLYFQYYMLYNDPYIVDNSTVVHNNIEIHMLKNTDINVLYQTDQFPKNTVGLINQKHNIENMIFGKILTKEETNIINIIK